MKNQITIEIDTDKLPTYTDEHLSTLWYVAQANPAPHTDHDAGQLAEHVAREIVRRWIARTPAPIWNHQGRDYCWDILSRHGKWLPVNGDENNRQWTPNPPSTHADEKPTANS